MRRARRLIRTSLLFLLTGCWIQLSCFAGNENFHEFRETAGPGLESGVTNLLLGEEDASEAALDDIVTSLIDGIFAIIQPDT